MYSAFDVTIFCVSRNMDWVLVMITNNCHISFLPFTNVGPSCVAAECDTVTSSAGIRRNLLSTQQDSFVLLFRVLVYLWGKYSSYSIGIHPQVSILSGSSTELTVEDSHRLVRPVSSSMSDTY